MIQDHRHTEIKDFSPEDQSGQSLPECPSLSSAEPRIVSVGTAVPPYIITQEEIKIAAREHFGAAFPDIDRLLAVFDHAEIDTRHFCVPLDWYRTEKTFLQKNEAYIEWACRLSREAIRQCLERAVVSVEDIDYLLFVSTTGLATPSIDSRLIGQLGMSPHTRRTPVWGLGCAGGAAGVSHAYHYGIGHPQSKMLLVAVELCGLTFHFHDLSKSNLVASALFGDGAAAVLVAGADTGLHGIEIKGTRSTLWRDSLDIMGWNFMNEGMQVVFSRAIPGIVKTLARDNIEDFLHQYNLSLTDIQYLLAHPGGVKVIEAYEQALGLMPGKMQIAREVLREYGNMSSVSVLFVLDRFIQQVQPLAGSYGLLTALGPGFCAENVLLHF